MVRSSVNDLLIITSSQHHLYMLRGNSSSGKTHAIPNLLFYFMFTEVVEDHFSHCFLRTQICTRAAKEKYDICTSTAHTKNITYSTYKHLFLKYVVNMDTCCRKLQSHPYNQSYTLGLDPVWTCLRWQIYEKKCKNDGSGRCPQEKTHRVL